LSIEIEFELVQFALCLQEILGVIAKLVTAHMSAERHPEEPDWGTENRSRAPQLPVKGQ
jgi:hypothetical protein